MRPRNISGQCGSAKCGSKPLFGEAKQWHGMRQFRLRGLQKVNMERLFIAAGQNLKRLLSARGWGRRPWPDGAAGFASLTCQMHSTME